MSAVYLRRPYFPIIYVRGYAMTQGEVEDTAADPYMGFNIGSSKIRQLWDGKCVRHFFESPLVRLMKDHGYSDVYHDGEFMRDGAPVPERPVVIYRYYERTSTELGDGKRLSIEDAAGELGDLLFNLRRWMCQGDTEAEKAFRVYLVAHSMGGLVCRAFLQNDQVTRPSTRRPVEADLRAAVDKAFTYATPHNGIDLRMIGNIPGFASFNDVTNFDRTRMRTFLNLPKPEGSDDVDSLNGRFDPDRFFNLVGTNDRDYDAGGGFARKVVGPMSDGLVRINNATTWGPFERDGRTVEVSSPRAYVYRSHSGHYGIVNSEDGYQNLSRFLFGNIRVDGVLEVDQITLPPDVQKKKDAGKQIRASYHIEVIVRVRGATWDMHRRLNSENSSIFRGYDELVGHDDKPRRNPHLFSAFLSSAARVNMKSKALGFSVDLRVLVPQYEVDGFLFFNNHFEGGYLYREKINIDATPGPDSKSWSVRYGLDSKTPNRVSRDAEQSSEDPWTFAIPIVQNTAPGISARLILKGRPWA
jgi:hypothetical protein